MTLPCPVCRDRQWSYGDYPVLLPTTAPGFTYSPNIERGLATLRDYLYPGTGPTSYPVLPVICMTCGNTVLLNVHVLGIADVWGLSTTRKV